MLIGLGSFSQFHWARFVWRSGRSRHGRAWPGHPRLGSGKGVDARDKPAHDGEGPGSFCNIGWVGFVFAVGSGSFRSFVGPGSFGDQVEVVMAGLGPATHALAAP